MSSSRLPVEHLARLVLGLTVAAYSCHSEQERSAALHRSSSRSIERGTHVSAEPELLPTSSSASVATSSTPGKLALYIGIDAYPRLPETNRLQGCVNDVKILSGIFHQRFGFPTGPMLLNEQATRSGIGAALRKLIEETRALRATNPQVVPTVLIVYSGHGSQVADQSTAEEGLDEQDGLDETWVPYDSAWRSRQDIRDDEIRKVLAELTRLGAQVLQITDACHSGSIYRGADFAQSRTLERPAGAEGPRQGPAEDLFPDIAPEDLLRGNEDRPLPGCVSIGACADRQEARECESHGVRQGCLTWILSNVLPSLDEDTTSEALWSRLRADFAAEWPHLDQTPQVFATAEKLGERFLVGGFPPLYATVVPGSVAAGRVQLNMGLFQGVAVGARFEFYPGVVELRKREAPRAAGTVTKVGAGQCAVELDQRELVLTESSLARLNAMRIPEFTVSIGRDVPAPVRAALEERRSFSLAEDGASFDLAVLATAGSQEVRLFGAQSLPRGGEVAPPPIAVFNGSTAEGRELLSEEIAQLAVEKRLMSARRDEGLVTVKWLEIKRGVKTVKRSCVEGVWRLWDGDEIFLQLNNPTRHELYVNAFAFTTRVGAGGASERKKILPDGEDVPTIPPNDSSCLPMLIASAERCTERTQLKFLLTSAPIPNPLEGSSGRMRGEMLAERGEREDLPTLLDDLREGRIMRESAVSPDTYWTTTSFLFEVEPGPPPSGAGNR